MSPQYASLAAQQQFGSTVEAARAVGTRDADLSAVTLAAGALLSANTDFYGNGAQGTAIRQQVLSGVRAVGATLDRPGFGVTQERGLARVAEPIERSAGTVD